MKEKRYSENVQESRWLVRIGTLAVCITRSGAALLKSLQTQVGSDVNYVTVKVLLQEIGASPMKPGST